MKERQLYAERKAKAEELRQYYQKVREQADDLETAIECFSGIFHIGDKVVHRKFGEGTIRSITEKYLTVYFPDDEEEKTLSLCMVIGMELISIDNPLYQENAAKYKDLMKNAGKIAERLERAASALEEYEEYLE